MTIADRRSVEALSRLALKLLDREPVGSRSSQAGVAPAPSDDDARQRAPRAGVFDLLSAVQTALEESKAQRDENLVLRRELDALRERVERLERWLGR